MSPARTRRGADVPSPEAAMWFAVKQAGRAEGRTFPRPSVGAVVFRHGRVLGRGTTRPQGEHAEVVALRSAVRRAGRAALRGASIAVTLEPCCHAGRSGPCTDAIVEAGIRRVYVGCRDPNPVVDGKGIRRLRRAGLDVRLGVLRDECREQHRAFLSTWERGRPFVTLKLAATLDGRIATATGESRWITGPASRAAVHRLRDKVDAVMVGSATALADDPELTARRGGRVVHRPVRVLVDSRLLVPPSAKLYQLPGEAWVLCGKNARGRRARIEAGARLFELPLRRGHLDLRGGLRRLAKAGLTSLLVEGGGGLAAALLRADVVDEIHWMLAPRLVGGDGKSALGPLGLGALAEAVNLRDVRIQRLGVDLHVCGRIGDYP